MATGIMFLVMFGLMFLGVPIAVSIYIAMLVLIGMNPVTTTNFIAQTLYGGVASFTNLALPFFMICGTIMETGGLSKRLVRFANSLVAASPALWVWSLSSLVCSSVQFPALPPQRSPPSAPS